MLGMLKSDMHTIYLLTVNFGLGFDRAELV